MKTFRSSTMSNLSRILILTVSIAAFAVGSAATTAQALALDTLRVNLLWNPGAESGKWFDAPIYWSRSLGKGTVYSTSEKFYTVEPKFGVKYFGHEKGTGDAATVGFPMFGEYGDAIDNGGVQITIGGWFLSQDGADDGILTLSWDAVDLSSRSSNWSSDWTTAKWDALTPSHQNKDWTWVKRTVSVPSGQHFALFYMLADRDDGSNNNVCFDGLVAALSNLTFDMDFGDLYANRSSTAQTFNRSDSRSKTLTLESSSKLNWKITLPTGIAEREIEVSTGTSTADGPGEYITGTVDGTQDITININPPADSPAKYSKQITIRTYTPVANDNLSPSYTYEYQIGTYSANLKADVYGLPTVSYVGPGRGSNDKVNVAVNENKYFEVSSGDPLYPGAGSTITYEWRKAGAGWQDGEARKSFRWESPGEYTLECRMVDANDVATDPLVIPVRVWERPQVHSTPPDSAINARTVSWYNNKYVGKLGEPVNLMAAGSTENSQPDERVVKYLWYDGNDALLAQQYGGPFATTIDPISGDPKFGTGAVTFDGQDDYVELSRPLPIFSSSFTVSMWVKVPSDAGRVGVLFGDYGLGGANVNFEINNNGRLRFYWSGTPDAYGTQDLRDDTWHFITFVRDKEDSKVYGYVDGEVDLEHSGSISDRTATVPPRIGRDERTGDPAFEGSIDEIAIFDRALGQDEIQEQMNAALLGNEDGLVEYWSFDPVATHTWSASDVLPTQIHCRGVTNYGVESDDNSQATFDIKIYELPEVNPGGPYEGKPNQVVHLTGTLDNVMSYPEGTDFEYQWRVQKTPGGALEDVETTDDGIASVQWTTIQDTSYRAELTATVTSPEEFVLTGSDTTTVMIASGKPIAMPGGPYRGGIAGGSFSPIQFQGNSPDAISDSLVGHIVEWEWSFGDSRGLDGKFYPYTSTAAPVGMNQYPDRFLKDSSSRWYFDVSNWKSHIYRVEVAVYGTEHDEGDNGHPYIQMLRRDGQKVRIRSITGDGWTYFTVGGEYVLSDGRIGVEVYAPGGSGLFPDDAEIRVNQIKLKMYVRFDSNPYYSTSRTLDMVEQFVTDLNVTPAQTGIFKTIDFPVTGGPFTHKDGFQGPPDYFLTRFTGNILILESGEYQFHVTSDEGFRLKIDGTTVTQFPGTRTTAETSGTHTFGEVGVYPIELTYFEWTGDAGLTLSWTPPGGAKEVVPGEHLGTSALTRGVWNPTHAYTTSGKYGATLRVQGQYLKWSSPRITDVEILDGTISGYVRAADLRTPVREVRLTLTSSHVGPAVLKRIAEADPSLYISGDGAIYALTDDEGAYAFEQIPLGSYRIMASKVEEKTGEPDFVHEFENNIVATELILDTPVRRGMNFVDLSVFPVGGRIVYSLKKSEGGIMTDVFVQDVVIKAQPVGSTSDIESLPSTKTGPTNYGLPLFAGKYLFKAERPGHDVRLIGTESSGGDKIGTPPPGYDSNSGLLTIKTARTDVDFIDYTTREITVYVEDSGGYPIDIYQDELLFSVEDTLKAKDISDTLNAGSVPEELRGEFDANGAVLSQSTEITVREAGTWWLIQDTENDKLYSARKREDDALDLFPARRIRAQVTGTNGFAEGEVTVGDTTLFKAVVPPGKYTVSIPNVSTAIVKGKGSQKQAEVDVTAGDQDVTMVIPVKILLAIGPAPKLLNVPDTFLEKIGLTAEDNPEGYMVYFPPDPQTHTYTITATANGNRVSEFTLKVTDDISQPDPAPAPQRTYPDPTDERYRTDLKDNGLYTISAGLPNMTVVDKDDPTSYLRYDINPNPDPAETTWVEVPRVLPKTVTFRVSKDGYEESDVYTEEVTVLGDVAEGTAPEVVSVPNVNYLVLHDPPGDGSYSYVDDAFTIKGIISDMQITAEDKKIPIYPSPWSAEREIDDFEFNERDESGVAEFQDLGKKGLLGYRDSISSTATFGIAVAVETAIGIASVALPAVAGFATQLVKVGAMIVLMNTELAVQYEVSPSRHLETNAEDELPDLMGPGKGDLYYGEGWTLGLQNKYRLGIKRNPNYDPQDPNSRQWIPDTAPILTYDILERNNQYVYTVRDIERVIGTLGTQVSAIDTTGDEEKKKERTRLENARTTWENLLSRNPAYVWQRDHIVGDDPDDRGTLESFLKGEFGDPKGRSELLVFSGGTTFEYSRTVGEASLTEYSTSVDVSASATMKSEFSSGTLGVGSLGPIAKLDFSYGFEGDFTAGTGHSLGTSWESGVETEQTVGFVLTDDDVGDNLSTYVYEGPWGTPIFFTDPGSVTSDPWQKGTNKAVDVKLELLSLEDYGPFDYHDGAHYQFKISSTGKRKLEGSGIDFLFYDLPIGNSRSATVKFNGSDEAPYKLELFKGFSQSDLFAGAVPEDSISVPSSRIMVSIYPPERDWDNSHEQEYPVLVQAEEADDYQIAINKLLRPRFADLRAPRATITAPYDGQRISPEVFTGEKTFRIEAFSDDQDLAKIQVQIRNKQTDGVWSPWQILDGMLWEEGGANPNVTEQNIDSGIGTDRRVFTFEWTGTDIKTLGVGEYALCAVAQDRATRLKTDGTQEPKSNVDPDPPVVRVVVDGAPPTVLTSIPDYQAKESGRIYRGELSVLFTDDMRADDFTDRTFVVTDLLQDDPDIPPEMAGFVSYSPTLRKATFVPKIPFRPNGYYQAEIRKPDTSRVEWPEGVHDLAGNPLDNTFMWTFRTTDAPFEETWSIALSATDGADLDGNNLAAVAYGAEDGEDEKDARAVPGLADQMRLIFLDENEVEFDRDIRPADGRLSHHWFFVVENAREDSAVTIRWRPSLRLTRAERQYQVIQLTEFDNTGAVANVLSLDPTEAPKDPETGVIQDTLAYTYTNSATRTIGGKTYSFDVRSRYFRLDVQKAIFVAGTLQRGTSGWKFLSVPIIPQRAEPFVNLGDDIDPFKLYQYDTELGGCKIYPFDIGEVGLQTGHGYFTRLEEDVEVDVGGALNKGGVTINLDASGWHAIGNPFIAPVAVADLRFSTRGGAAVSFDQAVANGWIQGTLYRWDVVTQDVAFLNEVATADGYAPVTGEGGQLGLWEGYWLKTHEDSLSLTIPVPADLPDYPPSPEYLIPQMKPVVWDRPVLDAGQFDLRLALYSESASDVTTTLGTHPDAQAGYDVLDQSEPPTLSKTVAMYFDHPDWGDRSGRYDRDYRPVLEVGEERTWAFVAYTDRKNAEMTLSWEQSIVQVPDDILLHFRRLDPSAIRNPKSEIEWQDMREVGAVPLSATSRITEIPFEVRAQRFEMVSPSQVEVIPGEAQVVLRWTATENPFIENYLVERTREGAGELERFELSRLDAEFVDRDVEEEVVYTYRLLVYFRSGAHWESDRFTVTVLPTIAETVLLQSFPNPFNPEVWIPYELAEEAPVEMLIYNAAGQLVRRLSLGVQPRGRYSSKSRCAYWDGRDEFDDPASSGVYFYVLRAGSFIAMRKMTVLK